VWASSGKGCLYYWTSNANAEVDFVLSFHETIYSLEVKAGISNKKKSLLVYGLKYNPLILSCATLMNFKLQKNICNYPLYAVALFPIRSY